MSVRHLQSGGCDFQPSGRKQQLVTGEEAVRRCPVAAGPGLVASERLGLPSDSPSGHHMPSLAFLRRVTVVCENGHVKAVILAILAGRCKT